MILGNKTINESTDVLIIGAGAAATMAALAARRSGLKVIIVDKGRPGFSGTSPRCGGGGNDWALFPPEFGGHPKDSHDVQLQDCVRGGEYLNAQEMTEIFNVECLERLVECESYGVMYGKKPNGQYNTRQFMNCSYPRGSGGAVGGSMKMMGTMIKTVHEKGIRVFKNIMITRLLKNDSRIVGVFGINCKSGEIYNFQAKATILCAGSATGLYKYPTCVNELTGDSYALSYNAGAELMNMEFLQFSIVMRLRDMTFRSTLGIKPLISAGFRWVNSQGDRIVQKYDPKRLELIGWWEHVYSIYKEYEEGRGPVYMDISHVQEETWEDEVESSHSMYYIMRQMGINPRREKVELQPGLHTFLGGARVSTRGETTLPGLYAAGEAAGHGGIFGADRTGGGIAASQVLGHRAGKAAAEFCQKNELLPLSKVEIQEERDRLQSMINRPGESPYEIEQHIKDITLDSLGIVRIGDKLNNAIDKYSNLCKELPGRMKTAAINEFIKSLEVQNLSLAGELVARAALMRKESRGQHRRKDFPQRNDKSWLKWIVLSKGPAETTLKTLSVPIEKYKVKPPHLSK